MQTERNRKSGTVCHIKTTFNSIGHLIYPTPSLIRTHELGEDGADGLTARVHKAVAAVRGDDRVLLGEGGLGADADGLLAIDEVAEAADQLGYVAVRNRPK